MSKDISIKQLLQRQHELEATLAWIKKPLDTTSGNYTLITNTAGDVYQGEAEGGEKHGRGKLRCRDGSEYRGSWHQGSCHGPGWYKSADGAIYIGEWMDNLMEVSSTHCTCCAVLLYCCLSIVCLLLCLLFFFTWIR